MYEAFIFGNQRFNPLGFYPLGQSRVLKAYSKCSFILPAADTAPVVTHDFIPEDYSFRTAVITEALLGYFFFVY